VTVLDDDDEPPVDLAALMAGGHKSVLLQFEDKIKKSKDTFINTESTRVAEEAKVKVSAPS
jgi:hypothetical protein